MAKLKLFCGSVVLLILSVSFSSFFTLTALAKLYGKSSGVLDPSVEFEVLVVPHGHGAIIDIPLCITLGILLIGCLALLAMIVRRAPSMPEQWSLQNVGWPLVVVNSAAQLLALCMYMSNFTLMASGDPAIVSGLLDVVIEIAITLVIAALLFVELLILLFKVLQSDSAGGCSPSPRVDPGRIRPVVFLLLFGVDLSAAFVPLHMKNLYQPLWGLPEDVVLGLPISVMFLCVGISIILSGIWLDRRGWHEPLLVGLALGVSAMLYAWLAPSAIHFILAMGLCGLGYGLALMAPQGFVMVHTDDKNKARGLAYLFAGLYAGSICGTAAGAMLAERIGYGPVFLLSAVMILLAMGYTWFALHGVFKRRGGYERRTLHRYRGLILGGLFKPTRSRDESAGSRPTLASVTARHYWDFLSNRYVLSLIFLSSLPSAIAVIGLLNYFIPVYLDRLGISQSIIGGVLILYGLCMVYLGPLISHYIDASNNKRWFVIAGCVLGGCAFLGFQFFTGLLGTIVAVLLLGLSSCLVLASQTTYALTLDVTHRLGQGRSIGIFRATSRVGQMLGPILFGWLIMSTDIHQGLVYFGLGYLATAVLFAIATSASLLSDKGSFCHARPQ